MCITPTQLGSAPRTTWCGVMPTPLEGKCSVLSVWFSVVRVGTTSQLYTQEIRNWRGIWGEYMTEVLENVRLGSCLSFCLAAVGKRAGVWVNFLSVCRAACPATHSTSKTGQMRFSLWMQILHLSVGCVWTCLSFAFSKSIRLPWPCTMLVMGSGPFAEPQSLRGLGLMEDLLWPPVLESKQQTQYQNALENIFVATSADTKTCFLHGVV